VRRTRSPDTITCRRLWLLIASGLLLGGCGTPRYASAPQPATDLSGHWVLDPAQSDDAARMIAAITPQPHPPSARDRQAATAPPPSGGSQGPQGGQHTRHGHPDEQGAAPAPVPDQPPAWGRVRPGDFIKAFALPPPQLTVEQQPAHVRIAVADARRRDFQPGDDEPFSVTDRYGSRKVSAGWQRDEFVIHSADGSRLTVVEHFRRRADDHLEMRVEFSAQGLKSLQVHSLYRRATTAELEAPSEGPPPPPPH